MTCQKLVLARMAGFNPTTQQYLQKKKKSLSAWEALVWCWECVVLGCNFGWDDGRGILYDVNSNRGTYAQILLVADATARLKHTTHNNILPPHCQWVAFSSLFRFVKSSLAKYFCISHWQRENKWPKILMVLYRVPETDQMKMNSLHRLVSFKCFFFFFNVNYGPIQIIWTMALHKMKSNGVLPCLFVELVLLFVLFNVVLIAFLEVLGQNDVPNNGRAETSVRLSAKKFHKITYRFSRTACIPASWQIALISAPEILSGRAT